MSDDEPRDTIRYERIAEAFGGTAEDWRDLIADRVAFVRMSREHPERARARAWAEAKARGAGPIVTIAGSDIPDVTIVDVGWWRDELTGEYPWDLGRP